MSCCWSHAVDHRGGARRPASLKVQSLKEVLQMVREEPGKLNYASVMQVYDIMMAAYLKSAGLDMTPRHLQGRGQRAERPVEGRIQLYLAAYAIVRGHVQGGRMRLLAVQNRTRAPGLECRPPRKPASPSSRSTGWSA